MKRTVKILWTLVFVGIVSFFLTLLLFNWGVIGHMPPISVLENPSASLASEVYANDNTLMGKYFYVNQNRTAAEFDDISPHVINALIATEDKRFYEHSGIDPIGTLAIPFYLLKGEKRGSSTITQQLALNLFGTRASNPIKRAFQKLNEWVLAIKLERNFTKKEILALYLNTVGFGDNVKGIKNAALTFYSKEPAELNLDEAAMLIGMLKGNTLYNPRINPKYALQRRNTVISVMEKNGYITSEQKKKAISHPIKLRYHKVNHNSGIAPYCRAYIREVMENWCAKHKKADGTNYNLYTDGLQIYTTIDPEMQQFAVNAVDKHLSKLQKTFDKQSNIRTGKIWEEHSNYLERFVKDSRRYKLMKAAGKSDDEIWEFFRNQKVSMLTFSWDQRTNNIPHTMRIEMTPLDSVKHIHQVIQAGFMAMDPETGAIKAWVGGPDFRYFKEGHIFTTRQVGSAIKPFLYCLAIMNGFTPSTKIPNEPIVFPKFNNWSPKNASRTSGGEVTLTYGLAHSLNLSAAYLIKQLTPKVFATFLKDNIEISAKVPPYPSIALGTPEISLYELIRGYSIFPNKGLMTAPLLITRIEDKNGNILANFAPKMHEVINPKIASAMVRMMQAEVNMGTGQRLRWRYGFKGELAGKTGTTDNNTNGWFMGFSPQILAGAWVGFNYNFLHFNSTHIGQGANTGLPIFALFMKQLYEHSDSSGIDPDAKFDLAPPLDRGSSIQFNNNLPPPGTTSPQEENTRASEYFDVGNSDSQNEDAQRSGQQDPKAVYPPQNNQ